MESQFVDTVRCEIRREYAEVATDPGKGFHFHTGRPLAAILGYPDRLLDGIPEASLASFAGTGNPFALGDLQPGEHVVDLGCGAGLDTLIAARMVGPDGHVLAIDMTPEMLDKARAGAAAMGLTNITFVSGYIESAPAPDESADVVISNGVLNLVPDKREAFGQIGRVLRPGGRLQIGDVVLQKPVSEASKQKIELWAG